MKTTPQEILESGLFETMVQNTEPETALSEVKPRQTVVESALACKDYYALNLLGLLSEVEIPANESIAPYARLLIDELKHGLVAWRSSTTAEFVQDLTTLWLGARLLCDVLDPDYWKRLFSDRVCVADRRTPKQNLLSPTVADELILVGESNGNGAVNSADVAQANHDLATVLFR